MQLVANLVMNLLVFTLLGSVAAVSETLQQLRRSATEQQAIQPGVGKDDDPSSLIRENSLGNPWVPRVQVEKKKRLLNAIDKFRAEVCYRMKKENGVEFPSFEACNKFMEKACNPGKDHKMDGDKGEHTSDEGYCKEFFPGAEKKAREQIEKEDREAAAKAKTTEAPGTTRPLSPPPAPSPGPAGAAGGIKSAPAPAAKGGKAPAAAGGAPAAAGGAPGPAPGPSPGPFGAPSPVVYPDDEKWYYAKGGKDPMRLHMDESLALPTQGYWGKLVSHEDMETATGDWGKEFGPQAGHGSVAEACRQHPDSEWCIVQGFGPHHHHHSSCDSLFGSFPLLVLAFFTAVAA